MSAPTHIPVSQYPPPPGKPDAMRDTVYPIPPVADTAALDAVEALITEMTTLYSGLAVDLATHLNNALDHPSFKIGAAGMLEFLREVIAPLSVSNPSVFNLASGTIDRAEATKLNASTFTTLIATKEFYKIAYQAIPLAYRYGIDAGVAALTGAGVSTAGLDLTNAAHVQALRTAVVQATFDLWAVAKTVHTNVELMTISALKYGMLDLRNVLLRFAKKDGIAFGDRVQTIFDNHWFWTVNDDYGDGKFAETRLDRYAEFCLRKHMNASAQAAASVLATQYSHAVTIADLYSVPAYFGRGDGTTSPARSTYFDTADMSLAAEFWLLSMPQGLF